MREVASQIVATALLSVAVPCFAATHSKPRHVEEPAHHVAASLKAHGKVDAKATRNARGQQVRLTPIKGKPRPEKELHRTEVHGRTAPAAPARKLAHAAPVEREPAAEAAAPSAPQEEIHVRHNRKQHFTPGSAPTPDQTSLATPQARKATSADFLKPFGAAPAHVEPVTVAPAAAPKPLVPAVKKVVLPKPVEQTKSDVPSPAPVLVALIYDRRGRVVMPPALKGSHEILVRQNEMADRDGLDRVQDDEDLARMREARLLVALPVEPGLQMDERLPGDRRFCRPWTAQFLAVLGRAYYARFHASLQVNSAVRTVEVQQRLLRTNGNAAPAEGETASPHLTGQAVDLAKKGLTLTQIAWIRGYLMPLVQSGKVDVEEEFQQACFHISVYRRYLPQPAPRRDIATSHKVNAAALATAMP